VALGILCALVVAVIGFTVGSAAARPSYPAEGSADAGFARDMSAHHAQAVELAMMAHQQASLSDIRTLGGDIALTQQAQIGMMQTWLKHWGLPPTTTAAPMAWVPGGDSMVRDNLMPGMATRDEVEKLKAMSGRDFDVYFVQLMLRHHIGGIHMVDEVLKQNPTSDVRALAETMKTGQTKEVVLLQQLLKEFGASPIN